MMNRSSLIQEALHSSLQNFTRRHFLRESTTGLGAFWLALQGTQAAKAKTAEGAAAMGLPHHPPRASRVIYLHMVGAPSQLELFEHKPELRKLHGRPCPAEFLEGKRFAFIKGVPEMLGPQFPFAQHGECGAWISDRLPHFAQHVDDVCFIKTIQTDQFNHGPAQLMVHTGQARLGYPSIGSWVTWGLGSENDDLPGFIVLLSGGRPPRVGKALWSAGFLESVYQGVQCRGVGSPVLHIENPEGTSRDERRIMLDTLGDLNRQAYAEWGDPETLTRIAQYEMAFRMQAAAPEAMEIGRESPATLELYGAEPGQESFANNCLLARRLAERGVRFIQLFDWGWDSHGSSQAEALNGGFQDKCRQVDRPIAALLADLKQRGMLKDTLVIFGGEFGRTPMREMRTMQRAALVGRDHHASAFTFWLAGGGVRPGFTYGQTDPVGYDPVENPVPLRDFHATLLHLLGVEHEKLTVPFQGLRQKLTGVQPAQVIHDIVA